MAFLDRCIFTAVSSGTGTFVESAPVTGYQSMEAAAAVDGGTYDYAAQSADLSQWEYGRGTYSLSGTSLARTTVLGNSLGGTSPINFTNPPQVMLTGLAEDFSGGTPGGSNTDVQFNNSSAFGGDSGFTYAGSGQATLALGTITANTKALNITGTFNNAAVNFDAPLFMNVTNTASATLALMDLQVGGTSALTFYGGGGTPSFNGVGIDYGVGLGIRNVGSGVNFVLEVTGGGFIGFKTAITGSGATPYSFDYQVYGSKSIGIGGGVGSGADVVLSRENAADLLALARSTNPQTYRVYNTTDAGIGAAPTNYERGVFDWTTTANTLTIGTQAGGTGTNRDVAFVSATGKFTFVSPGTSVTPTNNGDLCIQATSNTSLTFKYKGSDGTVRSASLTLS